MQRIEQGSAYNSDNNDKYNNSTSSEESDWSIESSESETEESGEKEEMGATIGTITGGVQSFNEAASPMLKSLSRTH